MPDARLDLVGPPIERPGCGEARTRRPRRRRGEWRGRAGRKTARAAARARVPTKAIAAAESERVRRGGWRGVNGQLLLGLPVVLEQDGDLAADRGPPRS